MKLKFSKVGVIAIILLLLAAVGVGWVTAKYKTAIKSAEDVIKVQKEKIAELVEAQRELERQAADAAVAVVEAQRQKVQADAKAAADKAALEAKLKAVEAAKPSDLAELSKQILGTEEVRWNGTEAVFSLAAFRKNTAALVDWQDFTLTREPNYKAQIAARDDVISQQGAEILALRNLTRNLTNQLTAQEVINKSLRGIIVAQQTEWFWKGLAKISIGFLAGAAIGTFLSNF